MCARHGGPSALVPARVQHQVRDDDLRLHVRHQSARARVAGRQAALEGFDVVGRQPRPHGELDLRVGAIEEENAARAALDRRVDQPAQGVEGGGQRTAGGHHFEKPLFTRQKRLSALGVVDVVLQEVPVGDAPLAIAQRIAANTDPAVEAVRPALARFGLVGLPGFPAAHPGVENHRVVVRMKGGAARPAFQVIERRTEEFQHVLIGEFELAGRRHERDERRKPVEDRAEVALPCPDRFLGAPQVLDVGVHAAPLEDAARGVGDRAGAEHEPAVFAVDPAHPRLPLAGSSGFDDRSPVRQQRGQVFGMDHALPALAGGLLHGQAGVLAPASIDEVDVAVSTRGPDQSRKGIEDAAELVLHPGPFATLPEERRCAPGPRGVHNTLVSVGTGAATFARRDDGVRRLYKSIGDTLVQ